MKNYDLGQYIIQHGNIAIFPITKDEVVLLKQNTSMFEEYFKMPYIAGKLKQQYLNSLLNEIDMENDYWFMQSLWLVVDTKAKEIFGTIKYQKDGEYNKIITNITMLSDFMESYEQSINLFAKFLSVNGYTNLVCEQEKEIYED